MLCNNGLGTLHPPSQRVSSNRNRNTISSSCPSASLYGGVHDYDLVSLVATDKNVFYSNIQIVKDTDRDPITTDGGDCEAHLNYQDSNYAKFGVECCVLMGRWLTCHNNTIDIIHQPDNISSVGGGVDTDHGSHHFNWDQLYFPASQNLGYWSPPNHS